MERLFFPSSITDSKPKIKNKQHNKTTRMRRGSSARSFFFFNLNPGVTCVAVMDSAAVPLCSRQRSAGISFSK